jgi:outer membrane protein with glycine zipper
MDAAMSLVAATTPARRIGAGLSTRTLSNLGVVATTLEGAAAGAVLGAVVGAFVGSTKAEAVGGLVGAILGGGFGGFLGYEVKKGATT